MMEIAVMIEGQNGLNWPRWQKMVRAVEELGFVGLYRSDHFTNANAPDLDSLELWVSLTWLADNTERIEFGPLVSPVSFRHPVFTARIGAQVDDLSGGRLTLGVGAGWQVREHSHYGFDLLEIPERFARFEEGLEVITRLLHSDEPVDFEGDYYHLEEAILLPHPERKGEPPILIGGNGPQRTLPLVARYAAEWNGVYLTPEAFSERNERLNELLDEQGRQPAEVRRSLMTLCVYGANEASVKEKAAARQRTPDELRGIGVAAGTGPQIIDQLGAWAEAGVQRVMFQWLDLDDLDGLAEMAHALLSHV